MIQKLRRQDVLATLRQELPTLRGRFDVKELALIGSVSRDEANDASDIDVLVQFCHAATLKNYMALTRYLEQLFGVSVDVATPNSLTPALRDWIAREAIDVS
jgi:uncharacterized protein